MSDRSTTTSRDSHDDATRLSAIIAAFLRGDDGSLDQLLLACHAKMERLAHRLLGAHPEIRLGFGDSCDITQQAWMRLAFALRDVRPETPLHVMRLACQQVRWEIIDLARKYGGPRAPERDRVPNVVFVDTRAIDLVNDAVAPSDSLTSLDELARFHAAVDDLPQDLRDVFSMRFYLEARVNDVAEAVGCDARTVKRRWARAKKRLQEALTSPQSGRP